MLIGIDVSKYNLGWDPMKALKPIGFCIQRASWSLYRDERFSEIYQGVAQIGIRGAYHYYSSGVSWKAQADLFLATVKDKGFHFYAVDYERGYNNLNGRTIAELAEFIKYVKAKTGRRCLAYFSPSIFKEFIAPYKYTNWANQQDVWIAQYPWSIGQTPLATKPKLPDGLNTWSIWQYGGGDVNYTAGRHAGPDYGGGLAGMDLNYFDGTAEEMLEWTDASGTPIPTPEITHFGWLKPRYVPRGPAIIAGSDAPKANHPTISLDFAGQNFIKSLNNNDPDVWALFASDSVGPTKGLDPATGKLAYIMAGWSGNVVNIIDRSGAWVKVESIDLSKGLPRPTDVNHVTKPHLVHRMTTVNQNGQFISYPVKDGKISPWDLLNDPLISTNGEFWLPAEWIQETATVNVGLNVRSGPGTTYAVVSGLARGAKINVLGLIQDGAGNKWANIAAGRWCCLQFGSQPPYTDWILK